MDNVKTASGQTLPFVLFVVFCCLLLLQTRIYMISFNIDHVSMML